MSRKVKVVVIALASVAILGGLFGGIALAADPPNTDSIAPYCPGLGWHGFGGAISTDTLTTLLGLTPEEIAAQRQEGKSLVQIAAAKGVTEDALVAAIMAAKKEAVQARVQAGTLTQEQADLMLQQMEQRTLEAVNRTTYGPPSWQRGQTSAGCGGFGGGMMDWGDQNSQGNSYGSSGRGMGPGMMQRWAQTTR